MKKRTETERYLVILEVSQKQAYIFGYKKLQNNIIASDVIRYVTSKEFFKNTVPGMFEDSNMVYDGGGHTILEFATEKLAREFVMAVTRRVMELFPGLELFAKINAYDSDKTPGENEAELIRRLEEKKALRLASFHQGKFGIEAHINIEEKILERESEMVKAIRQEPCFDTVKYRLAKKFENLGGKKNESNFIAVVHIDGNLMGRRVASLEKEEKADDWADYKNLKARFSRQIELDFQAAYEEMIHVVETNMDSLKEKFDCQDTKQPYFPVRNIILAGDDVCFVTEGRIGVECARIFLEKIWGKVNSVDNKNYSACAGVASVHQKYPFYKSYQLAEELCSNAKRMIAQLAENEPGDQKGVADLCAIDWHIEYGEMANGLMEIRNQYKNQDEYHLEARPYLVCGEKRLMDLEPVRRYEYFKNYITAMQRKETIARSKLKELRGVLKQTRDAAELYREINLMDNIFWRACDDYHLKEKSVFYQTADGEMRSLVFDAIELMDAYLVLEQGGAK